MLAAFFAPLIGKFTKKLIPHKTKDGRVLSTDNIECQKISKIDINPCNGPGWDNHKTIIIWDAPLENA